MLAAIALGGCAGSNKEDALDILATVPADAEMVAVVNVNTLVEQTGGKVKDGNIENADGLRRIAAENLKGHDAEVAKWLLSPESGLECTSAVAFYYKSKPYFSMMIADAGKLRAGIDKHYPGEWQTLDKVEYKHHIAILADRLWLLPDDDAAAVQTFANLSEVESYRSNKYCETIATSTDGISLWGSIDGLMKVADFSFKDQTMARMILGMSFNSPKFVAGSMNLAPGGVEASLRVLDQDLRPAKCELALSKIDTQLVASLGGNANMVLALAVSQKLVKQVLQLASSMGGQMPQAYASAIESIDGTIAYASNLSFFEGSLTGLRSKGAVQTNGKNNAVLLQSLQGLVGNVEIDGNTFRFADEGYGNGISPLSEVAKEFEGAWFGLASSYTLPDGKGKGCCYITLAPAEGSLMLNLKYVLK